MPDHVTTHVEQLGHQENQPNLLIFTERQGHKLLDKATNIYDIDHDNDPSLDTTLDVPITRVDQSAITSPLYQTISKYASLIPL